MLSNSLTMLPPEAPEPALRSKLSVSPVTKTRPPKQPAIEVRVLGNDDEKREEGPADEASLARDRRERQAAEWDKQQREREKLWAQIESPEALPEQDVTEHFGDRGNQEEPAEVVGGADSGIVVGVCSAIGGGCRAISCDFVGNIISNNTVWLPA